MSKTTYTIYGSPNCPNCESAKRAIKLMKDADYIYIDVYEDWVAQEMFKEKGFRTVPQIFDGEQHIGGLSELIKTVTNV